MITRPIPVPAATFPDLPPLRGQKALRHVAFQQSPTVLRERRVVPHPIIDPQPHEPSTPQQQLFVGTKGITHDVNRSDMGIPQPNAI
jgi:hypothetical protein